MSGQTPHLYRFTSVIGNLVMMCWVSAIDSITSGRVKVGGGDGGVSVNSMCSYIERGRLQAVVCLLAFSVKMQLKVSILIICNLFRYSCTSTLILNSHELTIHLSDAQLYRQTKANRASTFTCSEIHSRAFGLKAVSEWKVRLSESVCIYNLFFSTFYKRDRHIK